MQKLIIVVLVLAIGISVSASRVDSAAAEAPPIAAAPIAIAPVAADVGDAAEAVLLAAGDIATCASENDAKTAAVVKAQAGIVAALGDLIYKPAELLTCYESTWGPFKGRTRPVPGDHEYELASLGDEYFRYFAALAGTPPGGYYSYNLGDWHIIALNSNCGRVPGGCGAGSPQEQWLRTDLSTNTAACTLAYWHDPLFTSGSVHDPDRKVRSLYQALYDYGADVVLNAQARNYERFAPQAPDGRLDLNFGLREFVVGTGGHAQYGFGTPQPNSEVRSSGVYGVLKLTLSAGGYGWQFLPVAGQSFAESGSGSCHGAPPRTCLITGTEVEINSRLIGPGAQAELCPSALFLLDQPVRFTAPGQRLFTQGLPNNGKRATLRIRNPEITTAIDGNQRSDITIEHVQVDGARPTLGPRAGGALIEVGGSATGNTVRSIVARNTRSWSTLHIAEGLVSNDTPTCQNATIVNNTIGPAGTSDHLLWADGISLACGHSLVQGNLIQDATDGGIVIFGAPGSRVLNNTIVNLTQRLLGGINLVDVLPVNGNYTDTLVSGNVINAASAEILVGVAMGPGTWHCAPGTVHGATVTGNRVIGKNALYGFAVDGVTDWTISGNRDHSTHGAFIASGCGGIPLTPIP